MQDVLGTLRTLRRPPLLIRAARIGLSAYRREAHLGRHVGNGVLPRSSQALAHLIETEARLEHDRKVHATGYSPLQHVDILIAMMGEAQLICTAPMLVDLSNKNAPQPDCDAF
ncbi:DUF6477 family protein [Roseovarius sp. 217]|uniref:DUF6477 family protein n=1 Tax=Roseovarius sp. (strain 217) TaxID=314264 RepID=UPI0002E5401D|nr:DUF6477 family protein [Roseovarius sp. 217]